MHYLKAATNNARATKQPFYLFGGGVSSDVKILGMCSKQEISHSATHDVGLVSCTLESLRYADSSAADQIGIDCVVRLGDGWQGAPSVKQRRLEFTISMTCSVV